MSTSGMSQTPANLSEQIETDAGKLQSITVDGVTTMRRSLRDQIEVDRYLTARSATGSPARSLKGMILRIKPPGGAG